MSKPFQVSCPPITTNIFKFLPVNMSWECSWVTIVIQHTQNQKGLSETSTHVEGDVEIRIQSSPSLSLFFLLHFSLRFEGVLTPQNG